MTRIIFIVFAVLTVGAGYLTYYGIGAESSGIVKSVRAGSMGNISTFAGK